MKGYCRKQYPFTIEPSFFRPIIIRSRWVFNTSLYYSRLEVQLGHRTALIGIAEQQNGQSFVAGGASAGFFFSRFTC